MQISFLGASREVGKSAFLLEEKGTRVILDYGIKIRAEYSKPLPVLGQVDAIVLSHAHLDHSGFLPVLYEHDKAPCFMTKPTRDLSELLLRDSLKIQKNEGVRPSFSDHQIHKCLNSVVPAKYTKEVQIAQNTTAKFSDAGHIPGAAMISMKMYGTKIFYTGDWTGTDSKLHKGAFPDPGETKIMLTEATYATREHEPRPQVEQEFLAELQATLDEGKVALIPAFAVGRAQELLQIIYDYNPDVPVYLDGMARAASQIIMKYPEFIRDPRRLSEALDEAIWVAGRDDKQQAIRGPSIIVAPAGMLNGGSSIEYLVKLNQKGNARVLLTGYQVPGTNGDLLLKQGLINYKNHTIKVGLKVKQFDFSGHAGKSELMGMIKRANPEHIFAIHGDADVCDHFVNELTDLGFDAHAPTLGTRWQL